MPITASYAFKQAMKAPIKQLRTTIVLESGDSVITYTGNDNLTNLTINTSGNYFKAATGALEFTLLGVDYNLIGYKATVTLAVLTDAANDTWESADIGYYRVTEQKVNLETGLTSFKGVDALGYLATQPYVAGTINYPITVANLATAVVANTSVGLVTNVSTLPNGTYTIGEDLYQNINNVTYRDILGEVAGATATVCGALTGTGDVAFIPPQLTASEAISYDNLKTIKLKDRYGRVSSVVLSRQPQEDNVAVVDEETTKEPAGKNLFDLDKVTDVSNKDASSGSFTAVNKWAARIVLEQNVKKMLQPSTTYTFSADVTLAAAPSSTTSGANHNRLILLYKPSSTNCDMLCTDTRQEKDAWQVGETKHLTRTFTTPSDLTGYTILCYCYYSGSAGTGTFTYSNAQLELGTSKTSFEAYKPNGIVSVKLANNEILDDSRETLATPILNAVKGLGYTPFEATTEGHGWHTVGDRLAVYQTSPTLPLDYQELTYIESVQANQHINTGVNWTQGLTNVDVTIDAQCLATTNDSIVLIQRGITPTVSNWNGAYKNKWGNLASNLFDISCLTRVTMKSVFTDTTAVTTINGVTKTRSGGTANVGEFIIGTLSSYSTTYRLYKASMSVNGVLVRDFVPCYRKSDSVAGLFDKVNGVFYANAGSGSFAKGAVVAQPQPIAEVVITDVKLNLTGGISETIKGEALTESQTNYSLAGGIAKTIYNTEIKVDKQNQEISSVVSQLNQLSDSTAENFTQVNQTINNITTTIQETGGGNIILNSVGYDTEPDGSGLVGWTNAGTVSSVTSPESVSYGAVSGNEINLGASSSITQRVAVDGNNTQKYSLSFKAKKAAVGKVTVTLSNSIDNYVITLPAGTAYNWQSFSLTDFTASENYFNVTIATGSGVTQFAITDLILNVGNTTMQWVQASSEILNTQVAVTKNGVKVRSSVYDGDYVEITPLGFNGYSDASGSTQTVFTLNRDTTKVQKLRAESQMEMPPIKIVPITSGSNTGWAFVKMEDN